MKVKVPSSKSIKYVKVKFINAKKIVKILSIFNQVELGVPRLPIIHKIGKDKLTLILFSKFKKSEIKEFVLQIYK